MHFEPEVIEDFLAQFDEVKSKILAFEGCRHLELLQQTGRPEVVFTYSIWNSEADLEHYRQSTLFRTTWRNTKRHFRFPAQAWTLDAYFSSRELP